MKTGTLYYDYAYCPPTWNFFDALLLAEMWRIDLGLDRVRVRCVGGPAEGFRMDALPPYGKSERLRWHQNIVEPMPLLLPSCGERAAWCERREAEQDPGPKIGLGMPSHGFARNGDAAARGLFPFRAIGEHTLAAMAGIAAPYVTISLRETDWHKSRQSNVPDWLQIAKRVERMGFRVVVIRDAMKCQEPIDWPLTSPEASENCLARAALYAGAAMNLGISNGPLWFAWFMGAPVMIFDLLHDDEPCANAGSFAWARLKPGDRGFPNSKPTQRLVWEKARPDIVLDAFAETMEAALA